MSSDVPRPDQGEIVGRFGNYYLISDGTHEFPVPRTLESELAYERDYAGIIYGDAATVPTRLETDPPVTIAPTDTRHIYTFAVDGGEAIQNPPSEAKRVMEGLIEADETGRGDILEYVYHDIRSRQVRADVVNEIQELYTPIPPVSVQIQDGGWIIEDMFRLTWLATIYLRTRDFSSEAYQLGGGGGVKRTDQDIECIGLAPAPDSGPAIREIPIRDREVELTDLEVVFFQKAYWLATYRERYDDDLFWNIIERHVQAVDRDRDIRE